MVLLLVGSTYKRLFVFFFIPPPDILVGLSEECLFYTLKYSARSEDK